MEHKFTALINPDDPKGAILLRWKAPKVEIFEDVVEQMKQKANEDRTANFEDIANSFDLESQRNPFILDTITLTHPNKKRKLVLTSKMLDMINDHIQRPPICFISSKEVKSAHGNWAWPDYF